MLCKYLDPCPKQQLKQLYDELGTNEESLKNGAKCLMEWLEQQPHLPTITDENVLINFLVASKNSLERTKEILELRFTIRALMPAVVQNRDPLSEEYRNVIKTIAFLPLPKVTPEGYRVIIFRVLEPPKQSSMLSLNSMLRAQFIFNDILLNNDRVRGVIFILDHEHTKELAASILARSDFISLISKASKFRKHTTLLVKKCYVINLPSLLKPLFAKTVAQLKPKLRERIIVWKKERAELAQEIPKNILPPIYGGDELPLEELRDRFYEYVLQFRGWLSANASSMADLTKKPPHFKFQDEINEFGVHGSFRNLSVD